MRVGLHEVSMPLVHEFQTSSHRKSELTHILVEVEDAEGRIGWGEVATPSDPYFGAETTRTAWAIIRDHLVPRMLDAVWDHPDEMDDAWARVRGNEFAKAGCSGAVWDLWSATEGVSLAAALGGTRTEVVTGVSLGIESTIDELLGVVAAQVDAGYGRVKLKIAPGWDVEPVRAVRDAFPGLTLHVDANAVYRSDDEGLDVLTGLDGLGLAMIEQPFAVRDFLGHARLQARMEVPVCLDESIVELGDVRTALELGAMRALNIKVSRMGGLSVARNAHDLAENAGILAWCGGMHEFGIGRAANVAISSLPHFTYPSDVSGSDKYYARDVIVPPVRAEGGVVQVPRVPGLGHEVDLEWIAQNRTRHASIAAERPVRV
ncbi:MAG: o-succinylbenzoate synthase [Microbacterium sp.]